MTNVRKLLPMRLLTAICVLWTFGPVAMRASTWVIGDVFVAIGRGCYNVYSNSGVFKETVCDGLAGSFTTGCEFDPALDKLYVTDFSAGKVVALADAHPHAPVQTVDVLANGGAAPESLAFATSGGFFVGMASGNANPQKFNAAGTFLQKYAVTVGPRGSDWIDLSVNQTTLFYTSEGSLVRRFDTTGVGTQLTNFATIAGAFTCYALRLLPPGDGSGGLLAACSGSAKLLNGSGTVVHTYTPAGASGLFGLNLDPNGTSFWTSDFNTGNVYRININSGAVEVGPITVSGSVFGVCVKGERTAGAGFGPGPTCGHHTVHGHLVTTPPPHLAVSGIHHGQHGHLVTPGAECPPHAPFHSPGLTAEEPSEGLFTAASSTEPLTFVAGLNQDGTLNGNPSAVTVPGAKVLPARRGTVVQLFGSAAGLFLDEQDLRAASGFIPPASGSPLFYTSGLPEVRIGGTPAQVLFSGLAPGLTGVWQINLLIPNAASAGNAPVTINYEGDELTSVSLAIE